MNYQAILERFQRHLYQATGPSKHKPLSFRSQYAHLSSLPRLVQMAGPDKNYLLL